MKALRGGAVFACLPVALACLALACSSGVENESAFTTQRFLCAPELYSEWQAEQERCRSAFELDRGCSGVVSFAGDLEGIPVVVGSTVTAVEFLDRTVPAGAWRRDELEISGVSPYFLFSFLFTSVGGVELEAGAQRDLALSRVTTDDPETRLDDALAHATLRLTAGRHSAASLIRSGTLRVTGQGLRGQAGNFSLNFGDGTIEGCFYAFSSARTLLPFDADGEP